MVPYIYIYIKLHRFFFFFFFFLNHHGISSIHSLPDSSQQNGLAEPSNQAINNCVKRLLNSAILPLTFWDTTVQCAAFLYNSNPHFSINFKIPNKLLLLLLLLFFFFFFFFFWLS